MRAVRRGAIIGGTIVGSLLAVIAAVDCASPTQIIIDVRADKDLCEDSTHPLSVGFGVTKEADVEKLDAALEDFQDGCKVKADGVVGTMVIKPSGDKNATIGIRVVAAVGGDPQACQTDQSNCIIATRLVRFQPGETVRETVALSGACKGEVCGENQDCVAGKCVDRSAIQDDGGVEPDSGHPTEPDQFVPPPDTGIPDAGPGDACAHCTWGDPTKATCDRNTCTIQCTDTDCTDRVVCGNGLDCVINCANDGTCSKLRCGPGAASCTFACSSNTGTSCNGIQCDAGTCTVGCKGDSPTPTCNGVSTFGQTNAITCTPTQAGTDTCDNVTCQGDTCKRSCGKDAGGCGLVSACDGGCTGFEVFVPDAGGAAH